MMILIKALSLHCPHWRAGSCSVFPLAKCCKKRVEKGGNISKLRSILNTSHLYYRKIWKTRPATAQDSLGDSIVWEHCSKPWESSRPWEHCSKPRENCPRHLTSATREGVKKRISCGQARNGLSPPPPVRCWRTLRKRKKFLFFFYIHNKSSRMV